MKARCLIDYLWKPAEREDGRKRLRQAVRAGMNHPQKCEIHESWNLEFGATISQKIHKDPKVKVDLATCPVCACEHANPHTLQLILIHSVRFYQRSEIVWRQRSSNISLTHIHTHTLLQVSQQTPTHSCMWTHTHVCLSAKKLWDVIHYQAGFSLFSLNKVCYSLPSRGDYSKPRLRSHVSANPQRTVF